jgi:sialic acid synthase
VAARDLPSGHVLRREDLALKSPNDGLPPYELDNLIGRRLRTGLKADMNLSFDVVEESSAALAKKAS